MFNIQKITQPVRINHPLVRDAYLKKETTSGDHAEDVLIIEAGAKDEDMKFGDFDSYLYDLVTDLENLKAQAEQQIGTFDRVDIYTH